MAIVDIALRGKTLIEQTVRGLRAPPLCRRRALYCVAASDILRIMAIAFDARR
jgi:hypothetical protein